MLQFFAGRSGSGKTEEIYKKIESEKNPDNVILLVPDQSTFQNERRILNSLGAKKSSKIMVFGFKRLYNYLEEKYGVNIKKRIDDGAKAVLISLAAEEVSERLRLYESRVKKADFAELMLGAINEYKVCSITPNQLLETAGKISDEHLKEKLKESAIVYSAYNALLNKAYSDPDDDLTRLYEMLCSNNFFKEKRVYIDSFNGFSEQEYKIVEKIIQQAEYTGISMGCDGLSIKNAENSIFKEPHMTIKKLTAFAKDNNIELLQTVYLNGQKRFKNPSLAAVEESVFRFDGDKYDYNDNSVRLYEANNEYDEIQQTARSICELVRNENYTYNDITVICREPDMYRHIIESEFPKYEIPFFMSDKKPIEGNSLIRLIISAFDIVHSSFATENIFTFLKTELANLSPSEVCILENYVYMWDIRGKRWKKEFKMNPNGNVIEEDSNRNKNNNKNDSQESSESEELKEIEEMRKKAIEPLIKFSEKLSESKNGGEISYAVYELLNDIKVQDSLRELVASFDEQGNVKAKEAEARIWDITIDILDKMYNILKDNYIDSKRYLELLKLMIRKSPISDIPQTLDQVTIGRAGNIIAEEPKAVFVIGAIDGIFPASLSASGLFSDSERNELIGLELPLHNSVYDMSLLEKYNVYSALSASSERLFVSCHCANSKGERCKPSVIFKEIQSMLKNVKVIRKSMLSDKELFFTEKQSFEECAAVWNKNTPKSNALKEYFKKSKHFEANCTAIDKAIKDEPYRINNKNQAKKLFGEKIHLSASQAEVYYKCPFVYFCRYGLKAYPRKRAIMEPNMYGSIVHYILENIIRSEDFKALKNYDTKKLSELVEKYIQKYIEAIGGSDERLERFMAQFGIMEKNVVIVLKRLIDEFAVSEFEPKDVELKIGGENQDIPAYNLELPSGEKISLIGSVDRVDVYVSADDNKKYIRIVDYKTGEKKFNLSDVYYGLNMQMLLYLSAISKNGAEYYSEGKYTLVPAGILYMPSTPKSDTQPFNSEKAKENSLNDQRKNFKMNGLLIKDENVLSAMEKDIMGIYIPAKKDIDKCQNLIVLEEYGKIFSYIDHKLMEMVKSLFNGNVERNPAKISVDACQYCDYKTVCGYENGKKSKVISKYSVNETLKMMKEELENG